MGGSKSSSSGEIKFPAYQENTHWICLSWGGFVFPLKCLLQCLNEALGNYPTYTPRNIDNLMFGTGYSDTSFPAVFDMFGKFLAGLDVDALWSQIYAATTNGPEVSNLISAHAEMLTDDIETDAYPRFHAGMRDINAIQSSAFAVGRSLIENKRVAAINQFAGDLRMKTLLMVDDRWAKHLDWNKTVAVGYADLVKLYYSARFDCDAANFELVGKQRLWDIRLFEYVRSFFGALQGGTAPGGQEEVSQTAKTMSGLLGGAATGASIGSAFGPGYGTAIGAVIGGIVGLASSFIN